jgi:opacity protein-like surface antigen
MGAAVLRRVMIVSVLVVPLAACGQAADTAAPVPVATTVSAVPAVRASKTAIDPPSSPAATAAGQLTGTQYAYLKSADTAKGTITFDLVDWFQGKAAVAACKADGEKPAENDWCTGWYVRNKNKKLRTYPVAAGASLQIVGTTGSDSVTVDLKKFRTTLLETGRLFAFAVKAGRITRAAEVYAP